MINNEVLIGTAMLNAIWSQRQNDLLDLILPFARYAIGKKYRKGECVKNDEIASFLNEELGYQSVPHEVVCTMLKRLSPKILERRHGNYWLKVDLKDEVARFQKQRLEIKEKQEKVGDALASYLNSKSLGRDLGSDEALNILLDFFHQNGLLLSKAAAEIDSLKKKQTAKTDYLVGQFILEEHRKDSVVFAYLLEMVRGSFVASAIYLQPCNYTMRSSRFNNTTCYLDTRIILNLLSLNTDEEHASAKQLMEMLKEMGARVACFNHTVEEVTNIICAYKHSLQNPFSAPSLYGRTLPAWDATGITPGEIDAFLAGLHVKLRTTGIEIEDDPDCPPPENYPIDEIDLSKRLANEMNYSNEAALRRDVQSAAFVSIIRAGRKTPSIENCKAVFVTTNSVLVEVVENYLCCRPAESVSPMVLSSKLSSVLWLKCFATHGDYPKVKLLEDAMVSTAPSEDVLAEFYRLVDKMKSENTLSVDEAAAIRSGLFQARELMSYVDGDVTNVNEKSVEMVRARLRETYGSQDKAKLDAVQAQASKAEAELLLRKKQALSQINEAGEKAEAKARKILNIVAKIITGTALIATIILVTHACLLQSVGLGVGSVVLLILEIIGVYDILRGRWKVIKKLINQYAEHARDKAKDKEREKLSFLFE